MQWRVIKLGSDLFDILHTYGVGIFVASATHEPVTVREEGYAYVLSSPCITLPQVAPGLLDEIFRLPSPEEVLHVLREQFTRSLLPLEVANLDGLLAALFTRPNLERNCSVFALLDRHRLDPTAIERSIAGVHDICTEWKELTTKALPSGSQWLGELLKDYDAFHPCQPLPGAKRETDITAAMTLDPSLGYASRQPRSDGRMSRKVNLTMRCPSFAVLLTYIGAMRFLRAQPVAGDFIIYTIPVPSTLSLHAESTRPPLRPRYDDGLEQALMLQALEQVTDHSQDDEQWKALSYQALLSQGKHQAISCSRGVLDLVRLEQLKHRLGEGLLRYWKWLLTLSQKDSPYELHHLIEALATARIQDWEAHVFDVVEAELARKPLEERDHQKKRLRLYSILEVQEVSAVMESPHPTPLSAILERKDGTMRFGHALRQLREQALSSTHEILEDLESVQTCDCLMNILTRTMQTCEVVDADSPFIIVPTDGDLKLLLDDVERYGARMVAALLRLLSTLRYVPRKEGVGQVEDAELSLESEDAQAQNALEETAEANIVDG
jgi:hypothetical protein